MRSMIGAAVAILAIAQPQHARAQHAHAAGTVPLHDDLGDYSHAITTSNPLTQRYFDQGLRLFYGFNHAEAIRSFEQGATLDASCAMCWWGVALAYGPNINVPMDSASGAAAYAAIRRAQALAGDTGAKERAFIDALATRYGADPTRGRAKLDTAYMYAMRNVAHRFPNDDEAQVLYAEAAMLLGAWDYWTEAGTAKPHGQMALDALLPVVERNPRHAGACHFYIHAVEAAYPERAVACAERLPELMPGAGHLVHMPAHIYINVGRYADAIDRNVHALHADEQHLADMAPDGVYRLALHPHNGHFLQFAAGMIGRSAQALEAAYTTRAKVDTVMMRVPDLRTLQHYYSLPMLTMVRFGMWDRALAEPEPAGDLPYVRAVWHYARALALVATGRVDGADAELGQLRTLRGDERIADMSIWGLVYVTQLLDIAIESVAGEMAVARGQYDTALAHLRRGVEIEDRLVYDEPPTWHLPVRHQLGAVLLGLGRAGEAEAVYRKDLEKHRENGWSLFGLAESLRRQGRSADAAAAQARFERAWSSADVALTSSRFGPEVK